MGDYGKTRAAAAAVTQKHRQALAGLEDEPMADKIDTTPEAVEQAVGELTDLTRCRCHEAYTSRKLRDPDCDCDSADAVKTIAARISELEARQANLAQVVEKEHD